MLRATLKSLLSRKLRLILSGLAVVLAVMFVSGAFVLSDTLGRTFDSLFTSAYDYTDIQVQAKAKVNGAAPGNVDASVVDKVAAVPGVAKATGSVFTDGARVIGANGKVVPTSGAPRYGASWTGESQLIKLRQGHAPRRTTRSSSTPASPTWAISTSASRWAS